jgi:hypothetical protein
MNHESVWSVKQTASLLHLSLTGAYRYYGKRELTYSHIRQFVHYAPPDVAMRLLNGIFAGSRIKPIYINTKMDFDGDGDVDTDDVLGHAIDALDKLTTYLRTVQASGKPDMELLGGLISRGIQSLVTSERCAQTIADMNVKRGGRRKAKAVRV